MCNNNATYTAVSPPLQSCGIFELVFYLLALWWRLLASCSSSLDLFCPDPVTKGKDDEDGELVACVEAGLVYRLLRISFLPSLFFSV